MESPFAGFPGARAMLKRGGSALVFVAGSVIGGLALAFLVVALGPDLIRATPRPPQPATPAAERALPAPQRVTYAAAVQRAAPAVGNINTPRLVTERLRPPPPEPFGGNTPP